MRRPGGRFDRLTAPRRLNRSRFSMALPDFSMRQLLEAGAHFGHQSHRWNPKMAQFIFGTRNNIHIIDLAQTVPLLHRALQAVSDKVDEILGQGGQGLTKKERLMLAREKEKLERALGGIKDMGGTPDLIFVIDTNKEQLAIQEAKRLGIPVAAIVDTNCDPDGITFPVPANDDAGRAISLYCDLIARAAIDGISRSQGDLGIDIGAAETPMAEELPAANSNVAEEQTENFERLA